MKTQILLCTVATVVACMGYIWCNLHNLFFHCSDTRDNDESTCDVPDRVCDEVSKCFQSRLSDGVITRCMTGEY